MKLRPILVLCLAVLLGLPLWGQDREGGIIGTGIEAAGIFGTITHLGSIWVNGQHITFDPELTVLDSTGPTRAADLRPGHTVAVVAVPDGDGWRARHIRQVTPLVGPVSEVQPDRLVVLGTTVWGENSGIAPGDRIAVSGVWRGNDVVASRFDPAENLPAQITGTWLGGDLRLGKTDLLGIAPEHLESGDVVRAVGLPRSDGLHVQQLETGLFTDPVSIVQAEGYVSPPRPDGLYTVLGSGLLAYTDAPYSMQQNERSLVCGIADTMRSGDRPDPPLPTHSLSDRLGCPAP
ncbi:DUF5666 domain-containing protein [Palleronia caenipelagi]|uniref:DUF5666 domain-containing protein n=1 Tax=Palleronia caenipelagi TaxID=2489174 RepID=A0A547PN88_9RHOB|nr:DUF5666 domain-containing protein [Palleronia caenipelagi]TRD15494.1 hypothetical protein FEV53_16080 [Palleronia caenipelagi]